MNICKQQSETEMREGKWRYASNKARWKWATSGNGDMQAEKRDVHSGTKGKWRYASSKLNRDMQVAKRDSAPHTRDLNVWLCRR